MGAKVKVLVNKETSILIRHLFSSKPMHDVKKEKKAWFFDSTAFFRVKGERNWLRPDILFFVGIQKYEY